MKYRHAHKQGRIASCVVCENRHGATKHTASQGPRLLVVLCRYCSATTTSMASSRISSNNKKTLYGLRRHDTQFPWTNECWFSFASHPSEVPKACEGHRKCAKATVSVRRPPKVCEQRLARNGETQGNCYLLFALFADSSRVASRRLLPTGQRSRNKIQPKTARY